MPDRQTMLFLVVALCIVNGIFSPFLAIAVPVTAALMPELFPRTVEWVLFWSSILLASATLLVSGVPAALCERLLPGVREGMASMWIWMIGALVLSLPALKRFL